MGLMDKLGAAKRKLWSPITVAMLERGSDPVVRAGAPARVVVDVEGADDGTAVRVEVTLALNVSAKVYLLGEVPATVGRHELTVEIPAAAPPSSQRTEWLFRANLERTKGVGSDAVSPVKVVGHPDHAFWPDGPRTGSDDPAVGIELATDRADVGGTISGRVSGLGDGKVQVGVVVDDLVHVEGRSNGVQKVVFKAVAEVAPDATGAFTATIPEGFPPSLTDDDNLRIHWEARAGGAYARFAVLDPDRLGAGDHTRSTVSLLDLLT